MQAYEAHAAPTPVAPPALSPRGEPADAAGAPAPGPVPEFDALFEAYRAPILNFVYRLMGDKEDAADLTQDAFLKIYLALPRLRPDHVQAWVYRVATNVCLDELRHRRLVRWTSLDSRPGGAEGGEGAPAPEDPLASLWRSPRDGQDGRVAAPGPGDRPAPLGLARTPDPDTHPETRALRREQADEVRAVLDRLPPRDRAALVLREYRDLSYAEIGAALGVSRPAVKLLLLRARVRFRREWLRTYGGPPTPAGDTPAPGA